MNEGVISHSQTFIVGLADCLFKKYLDLIYFLYGLDGAGFYFLYLYQVLKQKKIFKTFLYFNMICLFLY